jgi:hypothetical protein
MIVVFKTWRSPSRVEPDATFGGSRPSEYRQLKSVDI